MSKNIVSVYDTITKRYVEIEVSEKICTSYNRTQWNIDDNDKSFYKHEIQFLYISLRLPQLHGRFATPCR